ncbi:MAG: PspC domain-containing protein [Pseudomonadota bacterium]
MNARPNKLTLNHEKKRFCGLCAGLADYLDVPVLIIRIIAVLACIAWPVLILVYLAVCWWLKKDMNESKMRSFLSESRTANHFRNVDYHKQLYRNTRSKRIAGVCSGIAEYLEVSTRKIRLVTILSFFLFGPFTFFLYGVLWIVLEKNPTGGRLDHRRRGRRRRNSEPTSTVDPDFEPDFEPITQSPESLSNASIALSLQECSVAFGKIETRLRDVEAFITSKKFRLHCEINRI